MAHKQEGQRRAVVVAVALTKVMKSDRAAMEYIQPPPYQVDTLRAVWREYTRSLNSVRRPASFDSGCLFRALICGFNVSNGMPTPGPKLCELNSSRPRLVLPGGTSGRE